MQFTDAHLQLLVAIQKDQTALIYTLWSVFQGLSLLLIGYVLTQESIRKNRVILACFSASILAFSVGNHSAIMRAQQLVLAATDQLHAAAKVYPHLAGVLNAYKAPSYDSLSWFHIVFAVCLAAGVWVPYLVENYLPKLRARRRVGQGARLP